ncbi:MAG: hypothetical protein H6574_17505 [Lewinellaceae bacterium]|nr:hypothetical protein [Lewinellaceae bacterium]
MNLLATLTQVMPVFGIAGTFLVILAYDRKNLVERVKSKGIETEGTVVEMRRNPGSLFGAAAGEGEAPVVDFTTNWGTHRHYSTNYMPAYPYKVGQKVRLWYSFYKSGGMLPLKPTSLELCRPDCFAGVYFFACWVIRFAKKLLLLGNF